MPNGKPCSASRESTIGEQRALFAQSTTFDVRRRIEHLLHARPTLRAFVANDNYITSDNFFTQDALDGSVLAFVDASSTRELENRFIDTSGLHDASIDRNVSKENCEATFG